jgi:MFS family permease
VTTPAPPQAPLTRYMFALAAHFAAGGMMGVVFPWLITHELHESDARVGLAQAIATLPMMLFILIGGANADGRDLRGYIARLQLGSAAVPIVLALLVATQLLTFWSAATCVFVLGIFASFIMPARDSLLSHVSPHSLGLARTAAVATSATFGGQLCGSLLAGSASTIGAVPLLCAQSALLAIAAVLTARLRIDPPVVRDVTERERLSRLFHELSDGLAVVANNERLRTILLFLVLGGPLFNGMFLVGFPLLVRDVYHGDAPMLATIMLSFLIGLTVSSFGFSRLRPVERPGRLLLMLSPNNILVFTAAHFAPPFPVLAALMFWWGLVAGVSMSLTRGMIQTAAPHAYRGRILSMLQFANVAGGPPGALLYGLMSQAVGILNTLLIVPFVVATLWFSFLFFSPLWGFRREPDPEPSPTPLG